MSQDFRQTADSKLNTLMERMYLMGLGGNVAAAKHYEEFVTSHPDYQVKDSERFNFDEEQLEKIVSIAHSITKPSNKKTPA